MACPSGCGGGAQSVEMMQMTAPWVSNPDGTYALASFPDCSGGHHGRFEGLSVFIVAPGTVHEKLFKHEELAAAADYVNSFKHRPSITKVPTSSLCDEAVYSVYG